MWLSKRGIGGQKSGIYLFIVCARGGSRGPTVASGAFVLILVLVPV